MVQVFRRRRSLKLQVISYLFYNVLVLIFFPPGLSFEFPLLSGHNLTPSERRLPSAIIMSSVRRGVARSGQH